MLTWAYDRVVFWPLNSLPIWSIDNTDVRIVVIILLILVFYSPPLILLAWMGGKLLKLATKSIPKSSEDSYQNL